MLARTVRRIAGKRDVIGYTPDCDNVRPVMPYQMRQKFADYQKRPHEVDREMILNLALGRFGQGFQQKRPRVVYHDIRHTHVFNHT